jgi:N-acetylglucosamine-6-phosphate deacetylase
VSTEITCQKFFDGDQLHSAKKIVLDDNGLVRTIEDYAGVADYPVVCPGFVDIQMNGFDDVNVATATAADLLRLDQSLLSYGTTSWLGTIVTAPLDQLTATLQTLHSVFDTSENPGFLGVHVEGPFLGAAPGAHRTKWIVGCDREWIEKLPSSVRLITVAPEQAFVLECIPLLKKMGVTVSLGHSRPSRVEFDLAISAGATMATHLFNGMSGIHHREGGLALWTLTHSALRFGLIADMVHVQPDAVSLAFKSAHARLCLVSDSVAWKSPDAGRQNPVVIDGAPRLPDGTLAGSSTPLGVCVQNVVQHCAVPLEMALASATSIPADTVGIPSVGRIRLGHQADILALDSDLSVLKAWRRLPS